MSSTVQEDNTIIDILFQNIFDERLFKETNLYSEYYYDNSILYLNDKSFTNYFNLILNSKFLNSSDNFLHIDLQKLSYSRSSKLLEYNKYNDFKIIPISISFPLEEFRHSNVIFIDERRKIIEFFEPHGTYNNIIHNNINLNEIIPKIIQEIYPLTKDYSFVNVSGSDSCIIGLQSKENSIIYNKGYCLAWSLLFIKLKINSPEFTGTEIINYLDKINILKLHIHLNKFITYLNLLQNNPVTDPDDTINFIHLLDVKTQNLQIQYITGLIERYVSNLLFVYNDIGIDTKTNDDLLDNIFKYSKFVDVHYLLQKAITSYLPKN